MTSAHIDRIVCPTDFSRRELAMTSIPRSVEVRMEGLSLEGKTPGSGEAHHAHAAS